MSKGQSVVVGAIILVLVFLGVVASVFLVMQTAQEKVSETGQKGVKEARKKSGAAIGIVDTYPPQKKIEIENIGSVDLNCTNFFVMVNSSRVSVSNTCSILNPNERKNLTLSDEIENSVIKVVGEYETWDEIDLTG